MTINATPEDDGVVAQTDMIEEEPSASTTLARIVLSATGVLFGGLYLWFGRDLDFGTMSRPGPGLFPRLTGLAVVGASTLGLVQGLAARHRVGGGLSLRRVTSQAWRLERQTDLATGATGGVLVAASLVVYVLLVERITFVPLSAGFVIIVALFLAPARSLRTVLIVVLVGVGFPMALARFFQDVLGVHLP